MKKHIIHLLSFTLLILTSQFVAADNNQQGRSGRQGPPQEAFTACENKSAGDSAQFEGRNGEAITGTCEEKRGKMVLIPDNMPSQQGDQHAQQRGQNSPSNVENNDNRQQGAPEEAFTVCVDRVAGDTSSFETKDGKMITGQCEEKDGKLVLIPDNKNQ